MKRPGIYFCICPDWELTKQHIVSKLNEFKLAVNLNIYHGVESLTDEFWQSLVQPNFFGDTKIVVLRGAENLDKAFWDKAFRVLSAPKKYVWPFFCIEKRWEKNTVPISAALKKNELFNIADKYSWLWQQSCATPIMRKKYIFDWAEKNKVVIKPNILSELLKVLPLDWAAFCGDLEKLRLNLRTENLELDDLKIVISHEVLDIFAFMQALQRKDKATVWAHILSSKIESSEFLFPFLGLMQREIRILWQLAVGESEAVILYPKIKEMKQQLARKLGCAKIFLLFESVVKTEFSVKSGKFPPAQALDFFVHELNRIFGS